MINKLLTCYLNSNLQKVIELYLFIPNFKDFYEKVNIRESCAYFESTIRKNYDIDSRVSCEAYRMIDEEGLEYAINYQQQQMSIIVDSIRSPQMFPSCTVVSQYSDTYCILHTDLFVYYSRFVLTEPPSTCTSWTRTSRISDMS